MVAAVSSTSSASTSTKSGAMPSAAEMQDRFLKLLVAQINNQDPLNPMDNAQMTTQMAQINTVSGIQQLNETLQGFASQFASMQLLQATALVGHDVLLPGNTLTRDAATGLASSAFDLAGDAQQVRIEILAPSGALLGTLDAGALGAGRHSFSWDASAYPGIDSLRYRVTATNGKTPVATTPYSAERVLAVGQRDGTVSVDLGSGRSVPYTDIVAVL
ncbi:MAG: flagellar hook assembly protein FlgD [Hylemonella sp.]